MAFNKMPFVKPPPVFKEANKLWWLKPDLLVFAVIVPIYFGFLAFAFEQFVPNTYIPGPEYWWGFVLLCTLGAGASIGRFFGGHSTSSSQAKDAFSLYIPQWVMLFLLCVTVFAYVVWFYKVVLNPQWIIELLTGQRANLRDVVSTKPGITTLTQCAIAYVIAYAIRFQQPYKTAWWETAGLFLVFLLTLIRVFLWSERLSIIELSAAFLVAWFACYNFKSRKKFSLVNATPLFAPLLLYLTFTGTEYFRSWEFYRDYYSSIWEFSFDRLLAYYATASNNGIGLLVESKQWPVYTGAYVFEWAYAFPGIGPVLMENLGSAKPTYDLFLENYARPELNNPSGIFPIVFDLGYFGSALYFLFVGIIIGMIWAAYTRKTLLGVLIYPIFFLLIIEILRFNYLSSTRPIPTFGAILLIYLAHSFSVSSARRSYLPLLTARI
jgi:oligosaccharide repeat unit polymerase